MNEFMYSMPRYFQNNPVIGKPLTVSNQENAQQLKQVEEEIARTIETSTQAGRSDDSLRKSGQMTPMDRLNQLIDPGSWRPLNSLYNPYNNPDGSTAVLTGLAKIHDRWSVVIVSDHKKLAGVWVGGQAYKLTQACDIALKLRIPLVYILNCSGIKLDEQDRVMAGRISGGTPFYRHMELAQNGIPVLVGIFGTNPAGGGYHSITPTILIAHEKANMAVGGVGIVSGMNPKGYVDEEAAMTLIQATKNAKKEDPPGNIYTHYNETGLFREVYGSEEGVLEGLKKYIDACPAYDKNFFRVADPMEPQFPDEDLYTLLPFNQRRGYSMEDILARLVDNSEFSSFRPEFGPEIFCGLAKFNGMLAGVIANYQGILEHYPEYRNDPVSLGGKLYRQGLIKMSEFVMLCARDHIPLVWFQDTTGIDVGEPAERAELLALGASLLYSNQNAHIPQMEITLRKGTGAAHYVMGGPMGTKTNVFSLGTATTEIYVMHSETATAAMYARRLVKDHDDGKELKPTIDKMNQLIQEYHERSRPAYCAQYGWVDEIVPLKGMREYICAFVEASYQNPVGICPFHQMLTPRMIWNWEDLDGRK